MQKEEKMLNVAIPDSLYSGFVESLIMNESFMTVLKGYLEDGKLNMPSSTQNKVLVEVICSLLEDMRKLHKGIIKTNRINMHINPN